MDIGIDSKGTEVHFKDALKWKTYFCPYCTETLVLRTGEKSCFAHNVIKERTPLQRTCPEYHENANYIDNAADVVYINNGGIPVYLCNDGNKFELRAYFPSINEKSRSRLIQDKTEIIINNKKWCYLENLNYYTLYDIKNWIDVKVNPSTSCNDVKRKWLWGIRGINIENDIYHANNEGGYRVAIKSNICVGKKYTIMFFKDEPYINGIKFKNIGEIILKEERIEKTFGIYEMEIIRFTEEARQFIDGKGYHLVEKASKVIPLWPPARHKGNELTFEKDTAWFYHLPNGNNEYFHEMQESMIRRVLGNRIFKVSDISICSNKAIIITNKIVHDQQIAKDAAEIKYILTYKRKLNDKKFLEPKLVIKDIEGQHIDCDKINEFICKSSKLAIESNIPATARVMKDSYCVYSSNYILDKIDYGNIINIDFKAFGNKNYNYNKLYASNNKINQIDWNTLYLKLYKYKGVTTNPTYKNKMLLYKIKKNLGKENMIIYQTIYKWIEQRKVPIGVQRLLDEIEEQI